ncbi:MAG: hypothetical protein WC285_00845, partial [Candidatus Gracilibacteria bacterium]
LGLNPINPDSVPQLAMVTNLNGMTVGGTPSFRLSGTPGDEVQLFLIGTNDPNRIRKDIGRIIIDENKKGEIMSTERLEDGEYYAMVEGAEGIGEVITFTVDNSIDLAIPAIGGLEISSLVNRTLALMNKIFPDVNIEKLIAGFEERQEVRKVIIGYTSPGKTVLVTWKSLILSSVVISDASQGKFEIAIPDNLPAGKHEVVTYALDEQKHIVSNGTRFSFKK